MTDSSNEKVYLLPRTIDYYQKELTRLLEFERYGEAVDLLRFLISCETAEFETKDEWQTLLNWIVTVYPESGNRQPEGEDVSEDDLFRAHLTDRTAREPGYAEKLLDVFRSPGWRDKQVLALEQLRYVEHPDVLPVLLNWLQNGPLPPALQFRALQILKHRGATGTARFRRGGQTYTVEIGDVPLHADEYPLPYREVLRLVLQASARDGIPLDEFAGHTWSEFVAYVYGTPAYSALLAEQKEAWQAWAAAFHYVLLRTAQGTADAEEIKERYGVNGVLEQEWTKAAGILEDFASSAFPSLS